jgi:CRP-like cAMP-binding protein
MSEKVIDVYRRAEHDFVESSYNEALAGFTAVVKTDPDHLWSRFQVGRTLERLKENNRAFEVFKTLASHCIKAGFPLFGVAAVKRAARLQAGSENTLQILSDLYSMESDRVDQDLAFSPIPGLQHDLDVAEMPSPDEKLPAAAEQAAKNFLDPRYPKSLPPVPLFSLLTKEACFPILEILQLRTFQPGEVVVHVGDPGTSIYLLVHGEVEVHEGEDEKSKTLARLVSGSVFGEMALITDAPRVASAVALRETHVLELPLEDLEAAAEDMDDITWAVAKFTRKRFLNNLLVTSPVFSPFSPKERREILERFSSVGIPTDEIVIREGTPGPGLYLILGGEVEVNKFEGDTRVHLANLHEGAVFGEISLVKDSPTTATVKATRGGEFLFLSKEDFQELVSERPEIKEALAKLSEERVHEQKQALARASVTSEDGAVIF